MTAAALRIAANLAGRGNDTPGLCVAQAMAGYVSGDGLGGSCSPGQVAQVLPLLGEADPCCLGVTRDRHRRHLLRLAQFLDFFTRHVGGTAQQDITRIEWRYLPDPATDLDRATSAERLHHPSVESHEPRAANPVFDPDHIHGGVQVVTPVGDLAVDLSDLRRAHYRFQGRTMPADELRAVRDVITAALAAAEAHAARGHTNP